VGKVVLEESRTRAVLENSYPFAVNNSVIMESDCDDVCLSYPNPIKMAEVDHRPSLGFLVFLPFSSGTIRHPVSASKRLLVVQSCS
jgi:hypothetical protein